MFFTLRNAEIALYALMNFIPYLVLMIYAFYHRARFSRPVTICICILATLIQIGTRFWGAYSHYGNSVNIILIRFLVYTLLLVFAIKESIGKILFVELIFSNISSFVMIAAACIESLLLSGEIHRMYCWHASALILLFHFLITLPFSMVVRNRLRPMIESKPVGSEWSYYWLIPALFYVIWQYLIYGSNETSAIEIRDPSNVIFLFVINIGALFVYYMIINLSNQLSKNMELERANHLLDIERLEYQILEERIREARHAKHDLRHHMIVMADYADKGDYEQLKQYLDQYRRSLPNQQTIQFCPNRTVNGLLLYFAQQARDYEIDFQVDLSLPEVLHIPDIDITVLLGNLLENAVDACISQQNGERRIVIHGTAQTHSLAFTIDNTCDSEIKTDAKGRFLSTKKHGSGIGVESVKQIVKRYNGIFTAERKGNMFFVSFMLNL